MIAETYSTVGRSLPLAWLNVWEKGVGEQRSSYGTRSITAPLLPNTQPLTGHTKFVTAVALGEVQGKPVVVSGSSDGTVRLWDARSGRPRGEPLTSHRSEVHAVALGEVDGQPVVVSGSNDGTVRLWDARSGRPRGEPLTGHRSEVHAVALGEVDGKPVVVSGSSDGTVRLWDARSRPASRRAADWPHKRGARGGAGRSGRPAGGRSEAVPTVRYGSGMPPAAGLAAGP